MSEMDRTTGVLNPEEKLGADERRAYQDKFLHEVVAHAYSSGTPLKAAMDSAGVKPEDVRTISDLQKLPVTKKTTV